MYVKLRLAIMLARRTHPVAPHWQDNEACHFSGKLIQFSARPRNLFLLCPAHADLSPDLVEQRCLQFDDIAGKIQQIIDLI